MAALQQQQHRAPPLSKQQQPADLQPDCIITTDSGIGSPGLPYYTREQLTRSPSIQQGMDPDTERRNRLQYTVFVQQVGMDLSVPQWAIYTAVYLSHQYYAKRSFQRSDKYLVAVACLYLGCKVQESPKYLRDVIRCAETRKWAKWYDQHPAERKKWEDPDHLERVRSEVLTAERAVLYTLCFQLRIQTPYTTVLALIKDIQADGQDVTNLTQIAWNLVNDSLKTPASLIYPPEQIGAACVYFAYITLGIQPAFPHGSSFCEFARTPSQQLEDILELLLSVYNTVLLPQGAAAAAQLKQQQQQEPFCPQGGGPGVQIRHDRLALVHHQPQQQPQQQQQGVAAEVVAPKPEPGLPPGDDGQQQQQQRAGSGTTLPVAAGVVEGQPQQPPSQVKTEQQQG